MILQFEAWYIEEFEVGKPSDLTGAQFNVEMALDTEKVGENSTKEGDQTPKADQVYSGTANQIDNQLEDEDAAVYRRAKQAVDELHRARKFEKSIKLR